MLIQLLINHPQAIVTIVQKTPVWVWGLLGALMALGISQLWDRSASLVRVSVMPVAMTGFSAWGLFSAFGSGSQFTTVLAVWLGTAAAVIAAVAPGRSAARYDAASRSYAIPGSVMPLLLIVGIFMTKYAVGVELAMQPQLVRDAGFALPVAAAYGVFSGMFAGRAARLWRLALRPAALPALA
jgi:hypothetical protein